MEEPSLPPVVDSGGGRRRRGPPKKWLPLLGIGGCPSWEMGGEIRGKGKIKAGRPNGVFGEERRMGGKKLREKK